MDEIQTFRVSVGLQILYRKQRLQGHLILGSVPVLWHCGMAVKKHHVLGTLLGYPSRIRMYKVVPPQL